MSVATMLPKSFRSRLASKLPPTDDARMLARTRTLTSLAVLVTGATASAGSPGSVPPQSGFGIQQLAEAVFVLVRTDPAGLMFEANAAFIVNDDDVVVIDGGSNPESAREVIAAIGRATTKPVRTVINTHWHDDHVVANAVYRDAYPDVEVIAHATTGEDMEAAGVANRKQFIDGAPRMIDFLRARIVEEKGIDGEPLVDEERISHETSIALAEKALRQAADYRTVLPTRVVEERLTLARGDRTIELLWLGRGHTRGDIVVHLPAERIVFTGDLVAHPVPLVGSTSFPLAYASTLEKLLALNATTYVPGHGPVLRDDRYVRTMLGLLTAIRDGTRAAVARGETLEQTRTSVGLNAFRDSIAGDSKVRRLLFANYVAGPAIARAHEHATEEISRDTTR